MTNQLESLPILHAGHPIWYKDQLAGVLETAAEGILAIGDGGGIQSVNPAAEKLFGYSAAEMVGQSTQMLMSGSHSFVPISLDSSFQVEGRRKDGSTFPIAWIRTGTDFEVTAAVVTVTAGGPFGSAAREPVKSRTST